MKRFVRSTNYAQQVPAAVPKAAPPELAPMPKPTPTRKLLHHKEQPTQRLFLKPRRALKFTIHMTARRPPELAPGCAPNIAPHPHIMHDLDPATQVDLF
eukprot:4537902-Amphidinium_carterae.1